MSAHKHTPGPWRTYEDDGQPWTIVTADGAEPIALANDVVGDPIIGRPQRTANAKLIAAAPALADALEATLTAMRNLRVIAFVGLRKPADSYPQKAECDAADEQARAALRAAARLP